MKRRIGIRDADSGSCGGEGKAKRLCLRNIGLFNMTPISGREHQSELLFSPSPNAFFSYVPTYTKTKPFIFGRTAPQEAVFNFTERVSKPIVFNACGPTRQARRKIRSLEKTLKKKIVVLAINRRERVPKM